MRKLHGGGFCRVRGAGRGGRVDTAARWRGKGGVCRASCGGSRGHCGGWLIGLGAGRRFDLFAATGRVLRGGNFTGGGNFGRVGHALVKHDGAGFRLVGNAQAFGKAVKVHLRADGR